MASLLKRVANFARSPQGRRLAEQAKRAAQDPQNQQRVRDLAQRVTRRRGTP